MSAGHLHCINKLMGKWKGEQQKEVGQLPPFKILNGLPVSPLWVRVEVKRYVYE